MQNKILLVLILSYTCIELTRVGLLHVFCCDSGRTFFAQKTRETHFTPSYFMYTVAHTAGTFLTEANVLHTFLESNQVSSSHFLSLGKAK